MNKTTQIILSKIKDIFKSDKFKIIIIGIALTIFFSYPYLSDSISFGHDLEYHLDRIEGIAAGIQTGQFPVKIHSQMISGLGYANSLFYPELFLYFPALLCLIGVQTVVAYKIFIVLTTFATFLIMSFVVMRIFKNKYMAVLSSTFYLFSFYRIIDVFMRADVGEILTFAFVPLVIYGCYEIFWGSKKKWYILAIGMFGVLSSHLLSAVFCIVLVIIITISNTLKPVIERKRIKYVFYAGILTILLSASFVLPMFEQMLNDKFRVTVGAASRNVYNNAISFSSIFTNTYLTSDFSDASNNINGDMSVGVGIILLILPALRLFVRIDDKKERKFVDTLLVMTIVTVILSSKIFPWQLFRILDFIQFPWRFLIFTELASSLLSGYLVIKYFEKNKREVAFLIILVYLVLANTQLERTLYSSTVFKNDFSVDSNLIMGAEYLPANTEKDFFINMHKAVIQENNYKNEYQYTRNGSKLQFNYDNFEENVYLEIPFIYYKGYHAYIQNGSSIQELPVSKGANALVRINTLNNLSGTIIVEYRTTLVQYVSYITSFVSTIGLITYIMVKKREN